MTTELSRMLEEKILTAMWSEHCSYSHTRDLISMLPVQSTATVSAGENAGVIELENGVCVAFRMESHNHPSALEPFEGAATGVGGIVRDILAVGARPIALLNSLSFGLPRTDRVRHLVCGVVEGISQYGNSIGVPTVGGELNFHEGYAGNPLVNVMAVGLVNKRNIIQASTGQPGDRLICFGAPTGSDGLSGAEFASRALDDGVDDRSAVQISDPYTGKRLLEAVGEIADRRLVTAMQDLGAAGIVSAVSELAYRSKCGARIDLARLALREKLEPAEILLSETQERMIAAVPVANLKALEEICRRWELSCSDIGEVTGGADFDVLRDGEMLVTVALEKIFTPPAPSSSSPVSGAKRRPSHSKPSSAVGDFEEDFSRSFLEFIGSCHAASPRPVAEQFDATVGTRTVVKTLCGDAAVLAVESGDLGIAVSIDSSPLVAAVDPKLAAELSVVECLRNVACTGARPLAVTNCLNAASPEAREMMHEIELSFRGLDEACRKLNIPVTGGNVSLYNETAEAAILTTHVIGAVGVHGDISRSVPSSVSGGDVYLVRYGDSSGSPTLFNYFHSGTVFGVPVCPDYRGEIALWRFLEEFAATGKARAAHDVSKGGLAIALAELGLPFGAGFIGNLPLDCRHALEADSVSPRESLFGEAPGRVLVVIDPASSDALKAHTEKFALSSEKIGTLGGDDFNIDGLIKLPMNEIRSAWNGGIETIFSSIENHSSAANTAAEREPET